MTRPLDGMTVVSLEHAIAAPFCTRQHTEALLRELGQGDAEIASLQASKAI